MFGAFFFSFSLYFSISSCHIYTHAATDIITEMCGAERQKIYNVITYCVLITCLAVRSISKAFYVCARLEIVLFIFGKCQKLIYVSNSIVVCDIELWECPKCCCFCFENKSGAFLFFIIIELVQFKRYSCVWWRMNVKQFQTGFNPNWTKPIAIYISICICVFFNVQWYRQHVHMITWTKKRILSHSTVWK